LAEVPAMPVPMLLISGARDLNTPVELAREWFEAVEAPNGKRHVVFEASGHAPFLTEPDRFIEIVGRYNPQTDPSTIEFDEEKVREWLGKGAQPSGTVARLLKAKNIG
jgi:fermentation-respiration switch protein FrsA (DUF1100 family)